MSTTEPRPEQLEAMAYVDGELDPEAAGTFEARMSGDPALAREVAELQALDLMARQATPPEPADGEWRRIEQDVLHQGGLKASWILLALGTVGLLGFWVYSLVTSQLPWPAMVLLLAGIVGMAGVLFLTLRERMRVAPYDPYRKVQR